MHGKAREDEKLSGTSRILHSILYVRKWRLRDPPKRWYVSIRVHCVTTHKTIIGMHTSAITSNIDCF